MVGNIKDGTEGNTKDKLMKACLKLTEVMNKDQILGFKEPNTRKREAGSYVIYENHFRTRGYDNTNYNYNTIKF